jgi:hypothetical protein
MLRVNQNSRLIGITSVVVISLLAGALFGGHFFTLITGEFPGPGPGFSQNIGIRFDTTTTVNTLHPEKLVSGPLSFAPQLVTWWWSVTGQMLQEADGSYSILWSRHAGVLTTIGKNWLEDQIGDSPSTTPATYISLSVSTDTPLNTWTIITGELNAGGMGRKLGAYASTGDGTWTILKQFTANATTTALQLTGLNWSATACAGNTLLCADTFTPVTLASGDKVTVTWSLQVT